MTSSDAATKQKAAVTFYQAFGSAFTSTAKKLKSLPAPSFSGGQGFATKVIKAFEASGPIFTANAKKIAAIDIKKNSAALDTAIENVPNDLKSASGPLADLDALKLTPQTEAAFEKLPACAKIGAKSSG